MNHKNSTDNLRINTSSTADVHVITTYQLGQEEINDYTAITTATDTDISIADGAKVVIKNLTIKNAHAATSNVVKISKRFSAVDYQIIQATLAAGESLVYDGSGWRAFTATGKIKVEVGSGGGSGDMEAATYDPATIAEQLVGLTATQTLENKTLTAPTIDTTANITDALNKRFVTDAQEAKIDYLTVTQAVDLDAIETRVNALDAAVILKGTWDASAGTFPGGGTAQAGESWIVSVGGTVDSQVFNVNDRIIAILDNASTGTFAANWFKADYTDLVTALDGVTGNVTLGAVINALTGKTTPVDADLFVISDTEAANASKKLTGTNLKAYLKTYFDTLYQAISSVLTNLASVWTPASGSAPASLQFHEDTDNGSHKITVTAPAAVASDKTLTLPDVTDTLVGKTSTDTLTNKRITKRVSTEASSATPTINTDNVDMHRITALATNITSMTTNLSGTPTDGQLLMISITGTAARTITWGASFAAGAVALPTTTVTTERLDILFKWSTVASKFMCMASGSYSDA